MSIANPIIDHYEDLARHGRVPTIEVPRGMLLELLVCYRVRVCQVRIRTDRDGDLLLTVEPEPGVCEENAVHGV